MIECLYRYELLRVTIKIENLKFQCFDHFSSLAIGLSRAPT